MSLAFAAQDVHFPIDKNDLIEEIGQKKILWTRNQILDMRKVLREADAREFENFTDLLSAVSHHRDRSLKQLTDFKRSRLKLSDTGPKAFT